MGLKRSNHLVNGGLLEMSCKKTLLDSAVPCAQMLNLAHTMHQDLKLQKLKVENLNRTLIVYCQAFWELRSPILKKTYYFFYSYYLLEPNLFNRTTREVVEQCLRSSTKSYKLWYFLSTRLEVSQKGWTRWVHQFWRNLIIRRKKDKLLLT